MGGVSRIGLHSLMLAAIVGTADIVLAQGSRPAFEVASIRRNVSQQLGGTIIEYPRGGGFRATKATVHELMRVAFGVRDDQLIGGPDWVRTDRFDINARAATDVRREEILLMIQTLMETRFSLAIKKEQPVREVYVLRVTRADGRLGPDLRKSPDDCSTRPTSPREIAARMPKPSSGARPSFAGTCEQIAAIARALERRLQTAVVDDTRLTGLWDFAVVHGNLQAIPEPNVDEAPSLFIALQEQLGLKLERERRPIDVVVIVSIRSPTEN
jgi:uncharacterized protein (TIGR03435 family)